MVALTILGALGGGVVFVGAVWTVLRASFRQINAIEDNTKAVNRLTDELGDHETRISRLEGARP